MITVACVLKLGGDYNGDYVYRLYKSIKRNTNFCFEFVCLSDEREARSRLKNDWLGWWAKIELFNLKGRVLYFDLDTVILNNIDCIFEVVNGLGTNEFMGVKAFHPERCLKEETNFNSSIMAWNGNFKFIYDNFDYDKEKNNIDESMFGDQDYISRELRVRNVKIRFWQDEIGGLYSYKKHCQGELPDDARVVCFHGNPRPREVKDLEWVRNNWSG